MKATNSFEGCEMRTVFVDSILCLFLGLFDGDGAGGGFYAGGGGGEL